MRKMSAALIAILLAMTSMVGCRSSEKISKKASDNKSESRKEEKGEISKVLEAAESETETKSKYNVEYDDDYEGEKPTGETIDEYVELGIKMISAIDDYDTDTFLELGGMTDSYNENKDQEDFIEDFEYDFGNLQNQVFNVGFGSSEDIKKIYIQDYDNSSESDELISFTIYFDSSYDIHLGNNVMNNYMIYQFDGFSKENERYIQIQRCTTSFDEKLDELNYHALELYHEIEYQLLGKDDSYFKEQCGEFETGNNYDSELGQLVSSVFDNNDNSDKWVVYVGYCENALGGVPYFVQYKSSKTSEMIGQAYNEIKSSAIEYKEVEWGEYYAEEN